jgi:hypothetical protein
VVGCEGGEDEEGGALESLANERGEEGREDLPIALMIFL